MKGQQDIIREQQKDTWNSFSPMWKKWDMLLTTILSPVTEAIQDTLEPEDTASILDIASGTGEPGLSIATTVPKGKVVLSDLSENMLNIAKERAHAKGIVNLEFLVCDACKLPFEDHTFDAVSSRLGFMFFPDMSIASKEMFRVLRPGGKIALSVWDSPEKNIWASAIAATVLKELQLAPPPPGAPGLFRCAKSGMVQQLLEDTGFTNTAETEVAVPMHFDSPEAYWTMVTEVTPPLSMALGKADTTTREKIKKDVIAHVAQRFPDGNCNFIGNTLLIYGEKA